MEGDTLVHTLDDSRWTGVDIEAGFADLGELMRERRAYNVTCLDNQIKQQIYFEGQAKIVDKRFELRK